MSDTNLLVVQLQAMRAERDTAREEAARLTVERDALRELVCWLNMSCNFFMKVPMEDYDEQVEEVALAFEDRPEVQHAYAAALLTRAALASSPSPETPRWCRDCQSWSCPAPPKESR